MCRRQNHDHAVALMAENKVPGEALINVVFRKGKGGGEFVSPVQGTMPGAVGGGGGGVAYGGG